MKKCICLLLAAVFFTVIAASCAGTADSSQPAGEASQSDSSASSESSSDSSGDGGDLSGEKITVLLPKHEMDTVGFHEEATRQFEEETGIQVELINMSWEQVADRITADLTAGGGSYDVIEYDNAWVSKFWENEWLEPLNGYISEEYMNGILPGLLDKFSVDGDLYGIPWNNDTRFFMYNGKMLEDAGYDHQPETWEDVTEMSQKIQENGVPYGYIDSYAQQQTGSNEVTYMVYSWGGKLFDDEGNPCMADDEKTVAAFQYMVDAMNEYKIVDPASLTADYESVDNVFNMGGSAFFLQAWPSVYAMANDPETSMIVDEIVVGTSPIHAADAEPVVITVPEAMAIPKSSKHKDAAWKYIEYMSSESLDKERAVAIGSLPIWTDLFTNEELLELYPYWADFGKQIEYAVGLPDLTWYDEYSNALMRAAQSMMLQEVSVEEGLRTLQDDLTELKASYDK